MRWHVLTFLFLLSLGNCFAQLNESDTAKFQIRASITGNSQQGNVELLTLRSKIDFLYSPQKNWVFKSQNSSLYQSFYSKEADNDLFSRNYLYYNQQNKIYPFAIAYVSTNFRRKIDSRYFGGAGLTYRLLNTYKNVLKLSVSAVYENTHFAANSYNFSEYNTQNSINLWRATLYVGGWNYVLNRRIRIYYDAYWQPAFNDNHNYRTQLDLGADFPIWKGLSFNAIYGFTHENVVVTNILQNDKILTFGLAYNFKKVSHNNLNYQTR